VSIDLSELRDSAQKAFPADKLAPERDAAWALVAEMGWLLVELDEDQGGLGLGRDAGAALHYELGRALSTAPLIPALLGLGAIAQSGLADKADWIERITGGAYVPLHLLPARLTGVDTVSGTVSGLLEADLASHAVIALPGRYAVVDLAAPGVTLTERPGWDRTRRLFDLTLSNYRPEPAAILAEGAAAADLHDRLAASAQLALAADCLGGADAALAMTVEYLKVRRQFDRPLALFQALKHRCADLKLEIAAAEALLWARASDPAADRVALGALKALASETFCQVTEEMVQLHGGIGLTEEHPCHLFLKRALLNAQLCGDADHWYGEAGRAALTQYA
jgi:alkylation response protein AidB-like acyl-CoA dehydrogenase